MSSCTPGPFTLSIADSTYRSYLNVAEKFKYKRRVFLLINTVNMKVEHFGKLSELFADDLVTLPEPFGKLSKSFAGDLTGKLCAYFVVYKSFLFFSLLHVLDSCIDKNGNCPSWKQSLCNGE